MCLEELDAWDVEEGVRSRSRLDASVHDNSCCTFGQRVERAVVADRVEDPAAIAEYAVGGPKASCETDN